MEKKKNESKKVGTVVIIVLVIVVAIFLGWLFANATENIYEVAFDFGNGAHSTVVKVKEKNSVLKPADPTREGYIFDGWYYNDVEFDFTTEITQDITLTAKWTKIDESEETVTYTVTFDSNGGSTVTAQTVEQDKVATEPTKPIRNGYAFEGWYNGNTKFNFATKITANITLTAKWINVEEVEKTTSTNKITTYTVKFNSNGGSTVKSQTVEKGKTATEPIKPTRSGYTFKGWYNGSTKFNFATKIKGNITLTAQWEKIEEPVVETKKYTVTFDSKGGSAVGSQTVEENKTAKEPSEPTRGGYTFKGWYLNGTKYTFTENVTGNITLTAEWEKDDVITWGSEKVQGALFPQVRIIIYKNGTPVAGTADFVDSTGAVVRKNVPITGKIEPEGSVVNLKNIIVN